MDSTTPETKLIKALRTILSFILAIVISTLSIAICFSSSFIDAYFIEKHFTGFEYTSGVQKNFTDYVQGIYEKNGLEQDNLDKIIDYASVQQVVDNYAGRYINSRVGFDDDAYVNSINSIVSDIRDDIAKQIDITKYDNADELDKTINLIYDYFVGEIEIKGAGYFETLFNIGKPVGYAAIGVCAFFFLFITLILFFLGQRRFRSFRAIAISFLTAGLFDICLAIIVLIISRVKRFDIYPIYLFNEFMKYVNTCIGIVAAAGFICIIIAVTLSTVTWINKNKR